MKRTEFLKMGIVRFDGVLTFIGLVDLRDISEKLKDANSVAHNASLVETSGAFLNKITSNFFSVDCPGNQNGIDLGIHSTLLIMKNGFLPTFVFSI